MDDLHNPARQMAVNQNVIFKFYQLIVRTLGHLRDSSSLQILGEGNVTLRCAK